MRRKRLEVRVSFEWVFLEPSIISTIRMGWELARWPSLSPGVEWTALNAMTSFSTSFPVPGAASYPSSVPLTRNFSWIEGRSFIPFLPAMNEFSAYAFSCPTKNIHRAIFPALDERFEKTLDLENIPKHFAKYIFVFEWNSLRKKEKKKNISYLHFVWTMHYSKYGSIVILLHRNVRRSCVRNLDRIYLN